MPLRIYFVGAHSTGKTTLARWTARQFGLPIVSEVVRSVLAEREIPLERLKTQVELHGEVQQEIFERQLAAEERIDGGYVSDRAIDNLVYAADGTFIAARLFRSESFRRYVDHVKGGIVFFARPDRRLIAEDGVRDDVSYDGVLRIDGAVKLLLELLEVPYVPITPANMQERCRLVQQVVEPARRLRELEEALRRPDAATPAAAARLLVLPAPQGAANGGSGRAAQASGNGKYGARAALDG
jgi:nicotinamide riboside kinase